MALQRATTSSSHSSQPDLSTIGQEDKSTQPGRKRKQPDIDAGISKALDAFMQKMQQSLDEFKADVRSDLKVLEENYAEIQKSLTATNSKQNELIATVGEICASVDFSSDRQDKLEKRVETTENYIHSQKKQEHELSDLKKNVQELQLQLNDHQQRERINNLEISGLPEDDNECLTGIIIAIAKASEVPVTKDDIVHVNRVKPRHPVAGRPRAVIVKFTNRLIKDNILAGIRKMRGIKTTDIELPGEPISIYVNEHLTPYNKALLKKTRETATDKLYEYVWTKNCQILARRNQGATAIHLRTEEDLRKIR